MTMVPRDPITVKQISEAKIGTSNGDTEAQGAEDTDLVAAAEAAPASKPGMPSKLPGYKK